MKKILFFVLLIGMAAGFTNKAEAKGIPIFYSFGGEKFHKLLDLPNDSTTMYGEGQYVDISCIYKQFSVFWIPIWNWDERYCYTVDQLKNKYLAITKEEAEEMADKYGMKLPAARPSLWDMIGGKVIILLILAFIIWGAIGKKNKDEEENDTPPASSGSGDANTQNTSTQKSVIERS